MDKVLFSDINSFKFLCGYLCSKEEDVLKYLDQEDTVYDSHIHKDEQEIINGIAVLGLPKNLNYRFEKMYIPKKRDSSSFRVVYKVQDEGLKNIHKIIQKYINDIYKPLDCVHGFVIERNVATNAKMHLSKKEVLKLDIKDFFPSIKKNDVINCFIKLDCKPEFAEYLATLVTLNDELVQGFNTSPVIANIILHEMDLSLLKLCETYDSIYTRYADDLYISSNAELPLLAEINLIITQNGFTINEDKTRIMKRGCKQFVTGLTVFDSDLPRIPKKFKNRIRFSLYYLGKYGPKSCVVNSEDEYGYLICKKRLLKGWIDYVNAIEPKLALKFYDSFNKIDWKNR